MTLEIGVLIIVITALVEILKQAGLPTKFAPLSAVLLGLLFAFIGITGDNEFTGKIISGLIAGASASGFYTYAKLTKGAVIK